MRARLRKLTTATVLVTGTFLVLASCSRDRPKLSNGVDNGNNSGTRDLCATPNLGCACDEPGKAVDCGEVKYRSGDYVACSMGTRTCASQKWGDCVGTDVVTSHYVAGGGLKGGGLHSLGLGTGVACPASGELSNPCDPYCNHFVDTTTGLDGGTGFSFVDGGLVVTATDGGAGGSDAGGGYVQGGYAATAGGVTFCGPDRNLVNSTCTVADLSSCQQDSRCDPITLKCVWNSGNGYFDPNAGGPDLTVGAPCGPSGSAVGIAPVCNRGSANVPVGSVLNFYKSNGMNPEDGCTIGSKTLVISHTLQGGDLVPGACISFGIPNSMGAKFLTINAVGTVTEGTNLCKNNNAFWDTDGSSCNGCQTCDTIITGKVYDPSGKVGVAGVGPNGGNDLPMGGVSVFQPAYDLVAFPNGKTCDTCDSLKTTSQAFDVTNSYGTFTLHNVAPPTGTSTVPVVVQAGRFRRTHFVNVTACQTTNVADGLIRLPRSRADFPAGAPASDLPKVGMVTGNKESLECFLRQVGFDDTEFHPYSAADSKRFQLFRDNGSTMTGIPYVNPINPEANYANNTADTLYNNMNEFNAVMVDCFDDSPSRGHSMYLSAAAQNVARKQAIATYANTGGRIFMDHWPSDPYIRNSPDATWATTGINWVDSDSGNATIKAKVVTGSATPTGAAAAQTRFNDWLTNSAGANTPYPTGFVQLDAPRKHISSVSAGASAIEWLRAKRSLPSTCTVADGCATPTTPNCCQNTWDGVTTPDSSLSVSFDTPVGGTCGVPGGHGVVFSNAMHVAERSTQGTNVTGQFLPSPLPATAATTVCRTKSGLNSGYPLTPEEKALEYQFFQLTGCSITSPPVPPVVPVSPGVPALVSATFTRDYQGVCPVVGTKPRWEYFSYQTSVPTGTSIVFRAATATTQAGLPAGPPPTAMTTIVGAGTSSPPGTPAPAWGQDAKTVEYHLQNDPPAATPVGAAQTSQEWLRIYMTFNPTTTVSPSISQWRQVFDCVPAE